MPHNVQFDEEDFSSIPKRTDQSSSFFSGKSNDAALLLAVLAAVLIVASVYFFMTAIKEAPVLGNDTLRPGEQVPDYIQ